MKLVLLALVSTAISTTQALGAPALRPGAPLPDSGTDRYTPTKCEWLAIELNANLRETKNGYSSYFFCRAPGTMLLSFKYENEAGRAAAATALDEAREAISQIAKDRNWRWIKIEEELVKIESPLPVAKPATKPASAPVARAGDPSAEAGEPAAITEVPELEASDIDTVPEFKATEADSSL